jgi:hypothetical protein
MEIESSDTVALRPTPARPVVTFLLRFRGLYEQKNKTHKEPFASSRQLKDCRLPDTGKRFSRNRTVHDVTKWDDACIA